MDAADLRRLCPGRLVVRGTLGSWGAAGRARVDAADLRRLCPGRLVVRGELGTLGLWPARDARVPLGIRSDGGKSLHALTGVIPYCAYRKVRAPGTVQRRRHEVCIAPRKLAGVASCRRGSSSIEELCRGWRGGPCLSSADTARSSRKVNAVFHEKSRQYPRFT